MEAATLKEVDERGSGEGVQLGRRILGRGGIRRPRGGERGGREAEAGARAARACIQWIWRELTHEKRPQLKEKELKRVQLENEEQRDDAHQELEAAKEQRDAAHREREEEGARRADEDLNREAAAEEVAATTTSLVCPASSDLMKHHATASDGCTYKGVEIEEWIQRAHAQGQPARSPSTMS